MNEALDGKLDSLDIYVRYMTLIVMVIVMVMVMTMMAVNDLGDYDGEGSDDPVGDCCHDHSNGSRSDNWRLACENSVNGFFF